MTAGDAIRGTTRTVLISWSPKNLGKNLWGAYVIVPCARFPPCRLPHFLSWRSLDRRFIRFKPLISFIKLCRIRMIMLNKWQKWPYLAAYALWPAWFAFVCFTYRFRIDHQPPKANPQPLLFTRLTLSGAIPLVSNCLHTGQNVSILKISVPTGVDTLDIRVIPSI